MNEATKDMTTKVSFEEYKAKIKRLPKENQLEKILSDMNCDLPVFYGKVCPKSTTETEKWYVTNIHQINSRKDLIYPYEDAPWPTIQVFISDKTGIQLNDEVFFTVEANRLKFATELLTIDRIVQVDTVLGRLSYSAEEFNCKNLIAIVSAFSPTGIESLDRIIQQYGDYDSKVNVLKEKVEATEKTIHRLLDAQSNLIAAYPDFNKNLPTTSVDDPSKLNIQDIQSRMEYKYSEIRVLSFLMALNTSQIVVLHGKPGTGKSMFARQISTAIGADYEPIEVQNNWTDGSDLLGYYNPMYKRYQSTRFLAAIKRAEADPNRIHIICLEEMNLARVEYYFALFLNLLQYEPEYRIIHLLPDDVERDIRSMINSHQVLGTYGQETFDHLKMFLSFPLPKNLRFVATINDDDYTNALSPKVIDRSFFIGFDDRENDEGEEQTPEPVEEYYCASCFGVASNDTIAKEAESHLRERWHPQEYRRNKYISQMYAFLKKVSKAEKLINLIEKESASRKMIQQPPMED